MNALTFKTPSSLFADYTSRFSTVLKDFDWSPVEKLAYDLRDCWQTGRQVFFCGNGGSGGNANHLANDFLYALSKTPGSGLRVHSLSSNPSVITCLANDEGYDQVFSLQLAVLARKGDVLITFSGSGNSPNILKALEEAKTVGMTSYAVLGFSGGKAKALADVPIHFAVNDMQIAEDAQMVIGHMIMQWLYAQRGEIITTREV
ncbi:SIS domain-containing protein [Bradyrhizobium sp. BTAi1]|jgi:D-sedoheptulose 7-phosphate isomerase|uniref:SIS domain-containing protein n=1 Tax=Bradyrhizobium sp. (strain BTAi1 / ATCC BAA-1182) TaxID=288000 RepID=UPI00005DDE26|nr:SIS domain-containing protein [Bradyrhizobium sp. BTAi1]ABQ37592.1 putative Phosphoheptose isomerase (Sedoheptulose 7-phosphate isomerase) [Bradyrhizobium sp. BTAi1]